MNPTHNIKIQPKLSKKTRLVIVYSPNQEELDKISKAIEKILEEIK